MLLQTLKSAVHACFIGSKGSHQLNVKQRLKARAETANINASMLASLALQNPCYLSNESHETQI